MIDPEQMLSNPHDSFFKELFSRPEVAADFLANYLPPEIAAALDLSSLEIVKDSFVDEALRSHLSDLLYRVGLQGGGNAYACMLFEHKSEPYDLVSWQILRYKVRAWELELRQGATKLPPIIPIVFYHGQRRWQVPREFSALVDFGGHDVLREFEVESSYYLCDISSYDVSQFKGAAILQAGLRLMQTIFTDEFEETLEEVFDLLLGAREPGATEYLRIILRYAVASRKRLTQERLQQVVEKKIPKPEAMRFMETLAELWMQQAIQQKSLELATRALRMVRKRIGAIDEATEGSLYALSFDQLADLMESSADFNSVDDLTAWMRRQTIDEPPETIN